MSTKTRETDTYFMCDNCKKLFPKSEGFYMYHYNCCSNECLTVKRIEKREQDNAIAGLKQVRYVGAHTYNSGGAC